jgi:hypothetical protein
LTGWFDDHFTDVEKPLLGELIEALVRLTLSHLVQPTHDLDETVRLLGRITDLVVPTLPRNQPSL